MVSKLNITRDTRKDQNTWKSDEQNKPEIEAVLNHTQRFPCEKTLTEDLFKECHSNQPHHHSLPPPLIMQTNWQPRAYLEAKKLNWYFSLRQQSN